MDTPRAGTLCSSVFDGLLSINPFEFFFLFCVVCLAFIIIIYFFTARHGSIASLLWLIQREEKILVNHIVCFEEASFGFTASNVEKASQLFKVLCCVKKKNSKKKKEPLSASRFPSATPVGHRAEWGGSICRWRLDPVKAQWHCELPNGPRWYHGWHRTPVQGRSPLVYWPIYIYIYTYIFFFCCFLLFITTNISCSFLISDWMTNDNSVLAYIPLRSSITR